MYNLGPISTFSEVSRPLNGLGLSCLKLVTNWSNQFVTSFYNIDPGMRHRVLGLSCVAGTLSIVTLVVQHNVRLHTIMNY